jgi:Tfp pilus assembly protein FimT
MNITKIITFFGWLAANWWILVVVAVLILVISLAAQLSHCNSKKFQQKTEEQKQEINQGKGEAIQIEEQRNAKQDEIRQADNTANTAAGNFNAVLNTDSGARDSNWSNAKREWCKDHANDSKCKQ